MQGSKFTCRRLGFTNLGLSEFKGSALFSLFTLLSVKEQDIICVEILKVCLEMVEEMLFVSKTQDHFGDERTDFSPCVFRILSR